MRDAVAFIVVRDLLRVRHAVLLEAQPERPVPRRAAVVVEGRVRRLRAATHLRKEFPGKFWKWEPWTFW